MSIMTKLYATLSAIPALAGTPNRVYPNILPQQPTYPAATYQFISNDPGPLSQLARFSDFHAQVTLHAADYPGLLALRQAVLVAVEAMPEFVTRNTDIEAPYEFEPKTFSWILRLQFRDAES